VIASVGAPAVGERICDGAALDAHEVLRSGSTG
jgi:hypothetical protein